MPLYEIFNYNITVQYKNTIFSRATFFVIIITLISILFPLMIAYRSRGLWLKTYTFWEHPDVHFKYQYLFIAETDDINRNIACGNIPTNLETNDCILMKIQEFDYTYDNKIDEIFFTIHASNPRLENINNIRLIMILDYKLEDVCPLHMESMVIYDRSFVNPTSKHSVSANLKLVQHRALPCWYNYKDTQYNQTIYRPSDRNEWIADAIYAYSRRNVSTALVHTYSTSERGNSPVFELNISIAISDALIRYKPGFWQELKHFWQQYLAIFIVFYYISNKIKKHVFINDILPTWQINPWKKSF